MLALAPKRRPKSRGLASVGVHKPAGERRARVALLAGCAQKVLDPTINDAAVELLTRNGVEVVVARGEGCCGALVHHMGREREAHAAARRNINAWQRVIDTNKDKGGLDAIVLTTSGCGTTIRDYGHMLRFDRKYAEKAARISALAMDISEFLPRLGLPESEAGKGLRLAYHAACSLQHGLRIKEQPKQLLARAGFTVLEPPESHLCCGSAGTYNILQSEISAKLKARKTANLESLKPDLIAAGNIGCIAQIGSATKTPIVHTVQLLNWAYGGHRPAALPQRTGK
jgi:glycolate oxidase iron-sulfur subunit